MAKNPPREATEPRPGAPVTGASEYTILEFPADATKQALINELNAQGAQGWHVVAIANFKSGFQSVLMTREL